MPKAELEYINEEDRIMKRKIIVATVAIFFVLQLIPVIVGMIIGNTMLEILSVCGILLLGELGSIPFTIAICCIVKWALD